MTKILAIAGPTASGKTKVAIDLAMKYNAEIVSIDSLQIYKDLQIGTAQPTMTERTQVPHHLIDFLSVDKRYSVAEYIKDADNCIADIYSRGKNVVLVGGTGFYLKAFLGQQKLEYDNSNEDLLVKYNQELANNGLQALVDQLKNREIDLKNPHRVIRELIKEKVGKKADYEDRVNKYDSYIIGLDWERKELYDRINKRVDLMFEKGLIDEVNYLYDVMQQTNTTIEAFKAIGYKEFLPYINDLTTENLAEIKELIKRNSRRYAKRQLTFLRNQIADLHWLTVNEQLLKTSAIVENQAIKEFFVR